MDRFADRRAAGRRLALLLRRYEAESPLVLALSPGGVEVAAEVAAALEAQLEIFAERRTPLEARTAILVDDGIASAAGARLAIGSLRKLHAGRVILAAPVIAGPTAHELRAEVDDLVYLRAPEQFGATSFWYQQFDVVAESGMLAALARAMPQVHALETRPLRIRYGDGTIEALLALPSRPWGLTLIAHAGSDRHPQAFASLLQHAGLATLLVNLPLPREEFAVERLAARFAVAAASASEDPKLRHLPLGFFGAGKGAPIALTAAAQKPARLRAVVSRGGRLDLAEPSELLRVEAPALFIVGAREPWLIDVNRKAMGFLRAERKLAVVPGATVLFEQPAAAQAAADLATRWYARHFGVSLERDGRAS